MKYSQNKQSFATIEDLYLDLSISVNRRKLQIEDKCHWSFYVTYK